MFLPLRGGKTKFILKMSVERRETVITNFKCNVRNGTVACQKDGSALHAQVVNVLHGGHACKGEQITLQGGFAQITGGEHLLYSDIFGVMLVDVYQHAAQTIQQTFMIFSLRFERIFCWLHVAAVAGEEGCDQSADGGQIIAL